MRQVDRKAKALSPSSPTEREIEGDMKSEPKRVIKASAVRAAYATCRCATVGKLINYFPCGRFKRLNLDCIEFEMNYIGISLSCVLSC